MKNIIKKWWFWLIIIVIIIAIISSVTSGNKKSDSITKLSIISSLGLQGISLDLNTDETQNQYAYVLVDCDGEFDINNITFVSRDTNIATVTYQSYTEYNRDNPNYEYSNSAYDYEISINIEGKSAGDTTILAQTTDGNIQSDSLSVNVTGDSNFRKLESLSGSSLADAINLIAECGYAATYKHADSMLDYTEEISVLSDDEKANKWIIVECENIDTDSKTIELTINTKENIAENEAQEAMVEKLNAKLGAAYAWQAVKAYGETEYPYGFDLHYIMGVLAEQAVDENTWFLKATVTVTNMYNAKQELTCEANVTGTDDNPEVIDFKVY